MKLLLLPPFLHSWEYNSMSLVGNLLFHGVYLTLAKNPLLLNLVENLKKRLYDFPRPPALLPLDGTNPRRPFL